MYYYFFYKIHEFLRDIPPVKGPKKFQAVSIIILFELFIVFSALNYRQVFLDEYVKLTVFSYSLQLPFILIILINGYCFSRNDNWKKYAEKFNNWSSDKKLRGGWIVFIVLTIILVNFIVSCILFSPLREINIQN